MIASKDFATHSRQVAADIAHRDFIDKALGGYRPKRNENIGKFQNWGVAC